ncbi:P-II family nitrogen regulator [Pectinatus haikarae]|uniref:Nitrogen regulatory protein PII 2 n=1 Tax=Pectinatus haikarae TaxID=349096 RepID=A0ABT9YAN5_9FIRM|nr:P-II family nitrogen regulator [Pectinatus haikarae]MDQ0204906.1 nitrogen regulatory protein PII 2 [Pectinatus haikarae]
MKEIIAAIRIEKIGPTKKALLEIGIPGFTAFKAVGRGKRVTDETLLAKRKMSIAKVDPADNKSELLMTEFINGARTFPCRVVIVLVSDADADKVVQAIIKVNRTNYGIGDGKIFIMPLEESIRIRTEETGVAAL